MILFAIHNVDSVQIDQVQFVVINVSTENIGLEKGNILDFLEEKIS